MSYENYLDFYDIFVNELSGSFIIFIALSLVVILWFCAKYRFPNVVTIAIMALWLLFMSPFMTWTIYILLLFVGGFTAFLLDRWIGNR